jgi:hypothetical protein
MDKRFCIEPAQMQVISDRIDHLTGWLAENASDCESAQKHLDEGTAEQVYWHYGYLCALRDMVSAIQTKSGE